jgi:hypothetical protein
MVYGVEITTSTGVTQSAGLSTFGLVKTLSLTSEEGEIEVPEFDSDIGFFVPIISNTNYFQVFEWNNFTKVLTWSKAPFVSGQTHDSDFYVYFFRSG